jgi:8-oxo-dGTP diphosphatase
MPYTPILATLAYVLSPDGKSVLLVHRNRRPEDAHYGKYNGLGGKMDPGETPVACIRRELREEAAIACESLTLKGTISWPGFGKSGEDWFGFLFRVDRYSGTPLSENPEGTLSWVPVEKVMSLPLWEGDRHFLPLIFGSDSRQFHGVMPYRDGKPVSWAYDWI